MVEIRVVDPHDETSLHRWWEIGRDALRDRPLDTTPAWEVTRVALPTPHPDFAWTVLGAYDGDQMVGAGLINLPQSDNTHLAYVDVYVAEPTRRAGVGSALLADVERRAREAGRATAMVEVFAPPGGSSPGSLFADARGYTVANLETIKAVDLAAAEPSWAALEDEAAGRLADYRVLRWRDTVPDEYAEGFCAMLSRFIGMVPLGDLTLEDGEWTVDRLRGSERRAAEIGQDSFIAAGVAPDGTLVGCSDVRVMRGDPRIGRIGITMVEPDHRGHRVGLAMKLATHRELHAAYPQTELVETSNADVNQRMNDVNEALGYRALEQLLEYHKRL
ncbi:MAG: GNAT family N-acetyltransferase [Nocardioides sp.]